jgi:hypothetical protein
MVPDPANKPTEMAPHLHPGRGLARAQENGDGPAGLGVVDMEGQEAALVIVGVEQRQLLMAMHHVEGVVDIEDNGRGRPGVAGAPEIDHDTGHADHVPQPRGVLPARDGGLRA